VDTLDKEEGTYDSAQEIVEPVNGRDSREAPILLYPIQLRFPIIGLVDAYPSSGAVGCS
jgi:hypothetical protein